MKKTLFIILSMFMLKAYASDYTETAFGINMKMIWVEGGDVFIGCPSEQVNDHFDHDKNVRRITVDGFYIGMLEVTQSQWKKVMGSSVVEQADKAGHGAVAHWINPDYPIYWVSWKEAMAFCRILSNRTGRTYTLPSEVQWEYAANGGNKAYGLQYVGSNRIVDIAWCNGGYDEGPHVCGSKLANDLGIYDMFGNVWEFCKDRYASGYEENAPYEGSLGFRTSASCYISRGGSWESSASNCVNGRSCDFPSWHMESAGFRVVCIP